MPPSLHRRRAFVAPDATTPPSFPFVRTGGDGAAWNGVRVGEWVLDSTGWQDRHPHDEINYVLEGTLFVSCDGETVEVGPGEVVHVPAGRTGTYWSHGRARMLCVFGPNPDGAPTTARPVDPVR
ncbi:cupin domain-containing protein [Pseudonocardia alni]|uniref:cupin domain-containing protein n=1 Tax=Pseudonocardia alni TaxID=33907 RepID=UPI0033F3F175